MFIRVVNNPLMSLGIVLIGFIIFSRIGYHAPSATLMAYSAAGFSNSRDSVFLGADDAFISETISIGDDPYITTNGVVSIAQTQSLASFSSQGSDDKEILEYRVQTGDTVSSVAEKFGIGVNTILWANDLSKNSTLKSGQKLTILPVSGMMHLVNSGESVGYLAVLYETDADSIVNFNEISEDNKIVVGDLLIIPGAIKPPTPVIQRAPIASSYFICPISAPCGRTQGLHWYNAVDFSNGRCGDPILAAAGGQVQKTGYDYIAGNYVRVLHSNGVVTFYGHMSKRMVYPGQRVYQGQIIGYVGNTGYTIGPTGCHVHFDVRGASNPFAY